MQFRAYQPADREACLALFDENCPAFFAPNEREDYEAFLRDLELGQGAGEQYGYVVIEPNPRGSTAYTAQLGHSAFNASAQPPTSPPPLHGA